MSLPAFSFPFAHWTPQALALSTPAAVTISKFIQERLLIGLSSGEIAALTPDIGAPCLEARLFGHRAAIVALEHLETVSETSTTEGLFLSLSADGEISKWSLADYRCLQSMSLTTSASSNPQGMLIMPETGLGEGRLTDSLVLVYGCTAEITILNAESLETVFVWTGHVDWPIPLVLRQLDTGINEMCKVLTVLPNGEVQIWVVKGKRDSGSTAVLAVDREDGKRWRVELRVEWGGVKGWQALEGGCLVVQNRGIGYHVLDAPNGDGFTKTSEIEVHELIADIEIFCERRAAIIRTAAGSLRFLKVRGGRLEECAVVGPPEFLRECQIMSTTVCLDSDDPRGKICFSSRPRIRRRISGNSFSGIGVSLVGFSLKSHQYDYLQWKEKFPAKSFKSDGSLPEANTTRSEMFSNMLAIAHGSNVDLYSLAAFALLYCQPTASISIDSGGSPICLLRSVKIGEHVGSSRGAGVQRRKEYLVVGTCGGDIFIIEAPSYNSIQRLPLFPGAVHSAHLLPNDLGRRLRTTLFVSSSDGTAVVVDVERARVMVTFPSHECSALDSFATKHGRNVVVLTYHDGVRREWDMGEEEGGVLLNPPPSQGSTVVAEEKSREDQFATPMGEVAGEWNVTRLDSTDDGPKNEAFYGDGDGALQLWNKVCRAGLPTVAINARAVIGELDMVTKTAHQRNQLTGGVIMGDHPAVVNVKSLLTALVPGGLTELLLEDETGEGKADGEDDVEEWRIALQQFFLVGKQPAILGQIGARGRISILTARIMARQDISPTMTSMKLLTAIALISLLLEATGKKGMIDITVERILRSHLGKRKVALGVFAKFWSDGHPLIRWVARSCLDAFMSGLTTVERNSLVLYWRDFLPTYVPPELSSAKEVARAVIILSKLVTDFSQCYSDDHKKPVARSVELLLREQNPLYQDTAIEVIGYSWATFQNIFDASAAIHTLVNISSSALPDSRRQTLHRCLLSIASKNSPLLATCLASSIDSASPPITIIAAMRLVTTITHTDPHLFHPVLPTLIDSILKTLDPASGMRERVLGSVIELVDALVSSYPTVAFHRHSQRLALSTSLPSIIRVYDLKAGNTANVLELGADHPQPRAATFLSWSKDGRSIAAVDLEESTLLVWKFVTGLLSFVTTATTGESDRILQPKHKFSFRNRKHLGVLRVDWSGDKTVQVIVGEEVMIFDV